MNNKEELKKIKRITVDGVRFIEFVCPRCGSKSRADISKANGHIGVSCNCGFAYVVDLTKTIPGKH